MGNSSSKGSRTSSRPDSVQPPTEAPSGGPPPPPPLSHLRITSHVYSNQSASRRGSRPDLSFLGFGRDRDDEPAMPERPRETKQERDARRAERDKQARLRERERSVREEGVDGGYLVTLGTYTGPEDFDKNIVRQLQIERRLAPFWKGLNDHSDSWTEAQLVAAVRGLPIPAADEVPMEMARTVSQASSNPAASDSHAHSHNLAVPMTSRSQSYQSEASSNLSASQPTFSSLGRPLSPPRPGSGTALLRGRAKTLASLATGSKSFSSDMTPQEVHLANDPNVNGLPIEAYLYKEASECPICFLYYPPHLNRTRCCDQPICSECFVQIKRPDPHPPEHEQPGQPRLPEEEAELLVSEIAACPFCVTPEFGVSYEPPPFRRGLAYATQSSGHPLGQFRTPNSAMSSSSSLQSAGRRRATSLSANAPQVITTDRVRPDWAKKLADARAHALRRSAAATALHNAAYILGNQGDSSPHGGLAFGRRRRTLFGDSPGGSGSGGGTPRIPEDGSVNVYQGRPRSHRNHIDDLDDLMMMEAIRLSLVAEEERKKKDDKQKAKEAKKQAKEAKKMAKKNGGNGASLYAIGANESTSTWASTSMARSSSNLGFQPAISEEQFQGKGKAPVQDSVGPKPQTEPTSTLNVGSSSRNEVNSSPSLPLGGSPNTADGAQRHLEQSRANLPGTTAHPSPLHLRQLSNTSSTASSFIDSTPGSLHADSTFPSATGSGLDISTTGQDSAAFRSDTPPAAAHGPESMFNFRSLAAMIGEEDKARDNSEHIEDATPPSKVEEELKEPSPAGSPRLGSLASGDGTRSRGNSGESSSSAPPPLYVEHTPPGARADAQKGHVMPAVPEVVLPVDSKELGAVDVAGHEPAHQTTQ